MINSIVKQADLVAGEASIAVVGDLDFSNVMRVYQKSLPEIEHRPALVFDFRELTSSNSAGLALLLAWSKYAKKNQKPIRFDNLSPDLISIARVTSVDKLLGI